MSLQLFVLIVTMKIKTGKFNTLKDFVFLTSVYLSLPLQIVAVAININNINIYSWFKL